MSLTDRVLFDMAQLLSGAVETPFAGGDPKRIVRKIPGLNLVIVLRRYYEWQGTIEIAYLVEHEGVTLLDLAGALVRANRSWGMQMHESAPLREEKDTLTCSFAGNSDRFISLSLSQLQGSPLKHRS